MTPGLNIPATTKINIATAVRNPYRAAEAALKALYIIKMEQQRLRKGDETSDVDDVITMKHSPWLHMKGVLKLGFSWEALDVLSFDGIDEMVDRLGRIAEQPGCLAEYVYAQEYIESDCEIRCYVIDDGTGLSTAPAHMRYTRPGYNNPETGRFQGFQDLSRQQAVEEWYGGNEEAVNKAEFEIRKLIKRWKLWLLSECSEVQPYMRFDFFVRRIRKVSDCYVDDISNHEKSLDQNGSSKGKDDDIDLGIYTGEMTELGGSTLNWQEGPSLIFRSVLLSCLEGDDAPPTDTYRGGRFKYESAHIRFCSDDENDINSDDSGNERNGWVNEPKYYEAEKQKYFETFGGGGVITCDDNETEGAMKRAKLSPGSEC